MDDLTSSTTDATAQPTTDPGIQGAAPTTDPAFSLPEKFTGKSVEDVARSYVDLEKKYGELSGLKNQLDQYGGLDNLKQWAQAAPQYLQAYQQAAAALQQAQSRQTAPSQQGPAVDPYENWDLLTPKEQAQRQSQLLAGALTQYVNAYGAQVVSQLQQQQAQQQAALNTQWDIYRTVMDATRKNPNLDANDLMQRMAKVATGDVNSLIQIASQQLTGQADLDAKINAEVQRRLADARLKEQNAQLNTLTNAGRSSFQMPQQVPASHDEATAALVKKLLQDGTVSPANF